MDLITIIIIAALVGALLIGLFFYKMKKGKGTSSAKDKSKEKTKEKGKKKSKKGDAEEEAEPATARSAVDLTHVQTQVNALIQQKEYAKAEGLLNASLKDDNSLYPLYSNLLNVYHLQDDDFAINQLFNSIEKQGLNEIYQKLNAEHESYKNIKAQELANKPLVEEPVVADEPEATVAPQTNTSAFDDLALDFNPASKATTAEPAGNSLDFSPSNASNNNSLDFNTSSNNNSLDFAKAAVATAAVTAATAAVASQADSNSLNFDDLKADNSLSFDSLQSTPAVETPSLDMPSVSTPSLDTPSLSLDTPSLDVPNLSVESNSLDFAPSSGSNDFNLAAGNELQFESNSINLSQPEIASNDLTVPELTLPELTVPEVSVPEVTEPSLSFNIDEQVPSLSAEPAPLSSGDLSFNLGDTAPVVESPKPDFSFNLDAPSVETTSTPSTSFVLDAEPAVSTPSDDIGTFDLSSSTLLEPTPSTPSNEFQFDIPSTPNVTETATLPEVTGNTFDVPSIAPAVAPVVADQFAETPAVTDSAIDSSDPLVQTFPSLAQVEPTKLDLDLVEQYIKLGQFDAARSLLSEVQANGSDDVQQRIADLQEKIA